MPLGREADYLTLWFLLRYLKEFVLQSNLNEILGANSLYTHIYRLKIFYKSAIYKMISTELS